MFSLSKMGQSLRQTINFEVIWLSADSCNYKQTASKHLFHRKSLEMKWLQNLLPKFPNTKSLDCMGRNYRRILTASVLFYHYLLWLMERKTCLIRRMLSGRAVFTGNPETMGLLVNSTAEIMRVRQCRTDCTGRRSYGQHCTNPSLRISDSTSYKILTL